MTTHTTFHPSVTKWQYNGERMYGNTYNSIGCPSISLDSANMNVKIFPLVISRLGFTT